MKVIFHYSTLFILLLFCSSLTYACSCTEPNLLERFRAADTVFLGEVVQFTELTETEYKKLTENDSNKDLKLISNQVTFKVEKQWKGKRQSQITTLASFDIPGMCKDLDLSVGKRILVYAPRKSGQLVIHRDCGPSRTAEYAKDEIKRLSNFFFQIYSFFYPYPKS